MFAVFAFLPVRVLKCKRAIYTLLMKNIAVIVHEEILSIVIFTWFSILIGWNQNFAWTDCPLKPKLRVRMSICGSTLSTLMSMLFRYIIIYKSSGTILCLCQGYLCPLVCEDFSTLSGRLNNGFPPSLSSRQPISLMRNECLHLWISIWNGVSFLRLTARRGLPAAVVGFVVEPCEK
jgi:hypothetical protein